MVKRQRYPESDQLNGLDPRLREDDGSNTPRAQLCRPYESYMPYISVMI